MKFQAEHKHLAEAVKLASAPIRKSTSPILDCLLIEASEGLTITGTNMDQSVRATCQASCPASGALLVRADDLGRWLASMPSGALVSADLTADGLRMVAGKSSITLPTLEPDDFPAMTQCEGVEVAGGIEAYRACLPFASTEETRFYLCGVFFGDSAAAATNGTVFRRMNVTYDGPAAIVPGSAAKIVMSAARLFIAENYWRAEGEGFTAVGKLIDGTFPDWRRIDCNHRWFGQVDIDALSEAIDAATIGMAAEVFISGADGELTVSGERWPGARNDTSSTCAYDGEDFAALVVTKNLAPTLAALSGSVAKIGTNGPGISWMVDDASLMMSYPLRDHRQNLPGETK